MKVKNPLLSVLLVAGLLTSQDIHAQNWVTSGNSPAVMDTLGNKTAHAVNIITNNLSRMLIGKDGNIGIGTSTPSFLLDVQGTGNASMQFKSTSGSAVINLDRGLSSGVAGLNYRNSGTSYWQTGIINSDNYAIRNIGLASPAMVVVFSNNNIGIGTATPSARLHVADSNVVFTATGDIPGSAGATAVSGAGRRMMWYPDKAAFRAGYVNSTQWDKGNIGAYSFAAGGSSTASGGLSTALGNFTTASGNFGATALGEITNASGDVSTAMGFITTAKSFAETVIGSYNTNYTPASATSWNSGDRLFTIGNGQSGSTSDAMVVLKNGKMGIGTSTPQNKIEIRDGALGLSSASKRWELGYDSANTSFYIEENGAGKRFFIANGGNVGIGTQTPAYRLDVCGTIRGKEVRVETGWCDYVFDKNYKLKSIDELEHFINDNKHLPGVAPAAEVEKEGLKVGEMNKAMMEKIEELTLYVIQLDKENKELKSEIDSIKK